MELLIVQYATQYPAAVSILTVIGILRTINKPLFALFRAYVGATATKKDDELLASVEASKPYAYFIFLLDYLASVKLPK